MAKGHSIRTKQRGKAEDRCREENGRKDGERKTRSDGNPLPASPGGTGCLPLELGISVVRSFVVW